MRRLVIIGMLWTSTICASAPTEGEQRAQERFVTLLAQARSPQEVEHIRSEFDELRVATSACHLQLQSKFVPVACYHSLFLREKWKLPLSPDTKTSFLQQIDELCAARASHLAAHLNDWSMPHVSSRCREDIVTARKIQKYREGGVNWSEN